MSLTFERLRKANRERVPLFKNKHGEVANCSDWTPAQWLQAMVGEVGEYANYRKKYERGDISFEEFQKEAKKELADIQIYLDILADNVNVDLGEATIEKFNEVSNRIGVEVYL